MRYLGLIILIYILIMCSGLLFVGIAFGACYIKQKIYKMDEEKWDLYFKSLATSSYLIRFWVLYLIALILVSTLGYYIFKILAFKNCIFLAILTAILGAVKMMYKFDKNKSKLLEMISELK